ncbi:Disintegrin and metalloproteinase domain-containing protein 11 [Heterocephalus glaber]|uniref:Disintegrin and metalloproteinase domain-containing protein 11 n=1 Tax=Heterocephalus glaber TaxID=10181 RepID=G5BJ03_HETGA|nr:Disintegrin and metalloproteinase domain-containing protein 11 [Heterocephalus glaber]
MREGRCRWGAEAEQAPHCWESCSLVWRTGVMGPHAGSELNSSSTSRPLTCVPHQAWDRGQGGTGKVGPDCYPGRGPEPGLGLPAEPLPPAGPSRVTIDEEEGAEQGSFALEGLHKACWGSRASTPSPAGHPGRLGHGFWACSAEGEASFQAVNHSAHRPNQAQEVLWALRAQDCSMLLRRPHPALCITTLPWASLPGTVLTSTAARPKGLSARGPRGVLLWGAPGSPAAAEVTEPSRLVGGSSGGEVRRKQLDPRVRREPPGDPPAHLAQVSFVIPAFNSNFTLDLELNHHLLSSQYVERHFSREGTPQHSTGAGDHCYYHGKLRGNPRSFAALSTCRGLHGVFSDGDSTYVVEPQELAGPRGLAQPPSDAGSQVRRGHPTVHSETKYVELIVINDHQLFEQMRQSVVLTSNFAKSVVNLADVIYKEQLNTRIVLVAMETWADGDKIQVQDDLLETLARLMVYRQEGLPEPSDATHLFSGRTFQSSSSGAAYVGGICSLNRGGGVNEYGNMGAMAVTLAQTLGQNLGMMWNRHRSAAGDCRCPDVWLGCIMEDTGDVLCGFLLCVNISGAPRLGDLGGDISSVTFYHQGKELDCRPNMLCLGHRCLPASAFNFSTCPGSGERRVCSHHGVCSNEGKCICQPDWTGKDCSVHNPLPTSPPTGETERYKGPSGTNIIIGSIAGAVLVAAIVLGGTGWGFKNIRRGRYDPTQQGAV